MIDKTRWAFKDWEGEHHAPCTRFEGSRLTRPPIKALHSMSYTPRLASRASSGPIEQVFWEAHGCYHSASMHDSWNFGTMPPLSSTVSWLYTKNPKLLECRPRRTRRSALSMLNVCNPLGHVLEAPGKASRRNRFKAVLSQQQGLTPEGLSVDRQQQRLLHALLGCRCSVGADAIAHEDV
jgi:hypothetical protein